MNTGYSRHYVSLLLCSLLALLPTVGYAGKAKEVGVPFPMKYEGGSLQLTQHDKLTVYVAKDQIVAVQGKSRFVIPVNDVTEVNYGNDVHRRVGAAIGVATVTLGIGLLMLLVKTKKHYVGVIWTDPNAPAVGAVQNDTVAVKASEGDKKGGVVFKVGKGDYRGFMTALEGVTGKKAVNADAVGSGGTAKP